MAARSYALRGDIALEYHGRTVTVPPEEWASDRRWLHGLDSMCQPITVDREAATERERCGCPDDCNCRRSWRTNYCGCKAHAA
jgi:hypothetical protein